MNSRLTFLAWFVEVLAVSAGAFFAWKAGVPQAVYANDVSMMTSVIAALFVVTAAYIGWQSWISDDPSRTHEATFAHRAERWAVMLGLLGTSIGLSLQAKALTSGPSSFGALATSLYTTMTGIVSALLIGILLYSYDAGVRRARK